MNHPTVSPTDPFEFEKESEHSITKWGGEGTFAFQSPLSLTREDLGPAFVQRNTTTNKNPFPKLRTHQPVLAASSTSARLLLLCSCIARGKRLPAAWARCRLGSVPAVPAR